MHAYTNIVNIFVHSTKHLLIELMDRNFNMLNIYSLSFCVYSLKQQCLNFEVGFECL